MSTAIILPSSSNTPCLDNVIEQPQQQQQQSTQSQSLSSSSSPHSNVVGISTNNNCTTHSSTTNTTTTTSNINPANSTTSNNDTNDDEPMLEVETDVHEQQAYNHKSTKNIDNRNDTMDIDTSLTQDDNQIQIANNTNNSNTTNATTTVECNLMVPYNPDPLNLTSIQQPSTTTTAIDTTPATNATNTANATPPLILPFDQTTVLPQTSKHKGLSNLGNTCYLNSALQMLFGVDGFVSMIHEYYFDNDDSHKHSMNETFPLHCALANLFHVMSHIQNKDGPKNDNVLSIGGSSTNKIPNTTIDTDIETKIKSLKAVIDTLTPQFVGYWQQDSHEFLSTVLDLLHDEYEAQYKVKEEEEVKNDKSCNECDKATEEDDVKQNEDKTSSTTVSTNTTTTDELPVLENDTSSSSSSSLDVAMKEEEVKEGYILVNKLQQQMTSSEQKDEQSNKKPRFTQSESAAMLETSNDDVSKVTHDIEQDETDMKFAIDEKVVDNDSTTTAAAEEEGEAPVMNSLSKVSSFSELRMKDISVLLHGEDEGKESDDVLSKKSTCGGSRSSSDNNDKDCKLVGGRVAYDDQSKPSFELKMAVDEETDKNKTEVDSIKNQHSDNMDDEVDATISNPPQSDHHQTDTASSVTTTSMSQTQHPPSPVDQYFTMQVQTCLTCNSCSFTRSRKETFRHLSLEIGDCDDNDTTKKNSSISSTISSIQQQQYERTIQEGLRNFFASEKLELKCEKCFGESATQSMEISRLPKVMILHLKRFIVDVSPDYTSVTYRKNRSAVEFGEKLSLDVDDNENGALGEFISTNVSYPTITRKNEEKQNEISNDYEDFELVHMQNEYESDGEDNEYIDLADMQQSYQLRSVVNHIGRSANCGHYTANVSKLKDSTSHNDGDNLEECGREWLNFNDEFVSEISNEKAMNGEVQKSAYLLLYELNK